MVFFTASRWCSLVVLVSLVPLAGCGEPDIGPVPRVPVAERHVIPGGSPTGAPLNLPADKPFNIHTKQGHHDKGANGEAASDASATPAGNASAFARVENGGSASAEFKIGHRVDNNSGQGQLMTTQITLQLRHSIEATDPPVPATLAKADLRLMVVDSRKRVVTNTTLVQTDTDKTLAEAATVPQDRSITARLEPGESYDVVLYGKTEAGAGERQKSAANLEVERLTMSFTFAPVATQPASMQ